MIDAVSQEIIDKTIRYLKEFNFQEPWIRVVRKALEKQATGTCRRCWMGVDSDDDGNCVLCARLTDEHAEDIRRRAAANL